MSLHSIKIQNIIWETDNKNTILPNNLCLHNEVVDKKITGTEEKISTYRDEIISFISDIYGCSILSADIDIKRCICLKERNSFHRIKTFFTTYELTEEELYNFAVSELKDSYSKHEFLYISKNNFCEKPDYNTLLSFVKQNVIRKIDEYMDNLAMITRCLNNNYFKFTFMDDFFRKYNLGNIDLDRITLIYNNDNIEIYIDIPQINELSENKEDNNMEVFIVSIRNKESGYETISSVAFSKEEAELMRIYAMGDKSANPEYKDENYEFIISKGNLSMEQVKEYVSSKIENMSVNEIDEEMVREEVNSQIEKEKQLEQEESISSEANEELHNIFEEER